MLPQSSVVLPQNQVITSASSQTTTTSCLFNSSNFRAALKTPQQHSRHRPPRSILITLQESRCVWKAGGEFGSLFSSPCLHEASVYIGSLSGKFLAFDCENGDLRYVTVSSEWTVVKQVERQLAFYSDKFLHFHLKARNDGETVCFWCSVFNVAHKFCNFRFLLPTLLLQ